MDRNAELERLRNRLQRLRGTGPVQPEFYQWVADARQFLVAAYGDHSAEVARLNSLAFENTVPDDAYMHHDGPWGLFERIARAEELLAELSATAA